MKESIYQKIEEANLDKELRYILLKLLQFNSTHKVLIPVQNFLTEYKIASENYWESLKQCNQIDDAFESYYHYEKNKCVLVDSLLDSLKISLKFDQVKEEIREMMYEGFTF